MRKKSLLMTLLLLTCLLGARAQQALPYSYGFEDNDLAADGWVLQGAASENTKIYTGAKRTGTYGFQFIYSEQSAYLLSPVLTGGDKGVDVSFWYKNYSGNYPEHFKVGYTTDEAATDASAFIYGDEVTASTSWQEYSNVFPAGTRRIAIQYVYTDAYYLFLDDFSFTVPTGVARPSDLAVALTQGDGTVATLSWLQGGDAAAWEICLNDDETNLISANTNPFTLTGLTPETAYTAKVRAVKGSDKSEWSNAVTFTPTNAYWITVNDGTDANGFVPVYGYYADGASLSQFIIPASDLTTIQWGTITNLTFYASQNSVDWGNAKFEVYVAEVANTTLDDMVDWSTMEKVMNAGTLSISNNQMEVTFDNPYQYQGGNLLIGIRETTSGSWGTSTWYGVNQTENTAMGNVEDSGTTYEPKQFLPKTTFIYIPGVAPSCIKPIGVTVKASHTSATISWIGDNDSYNVRYRLPAEDITSFFDDFEDGLDQWTIYTEGQAPKEKGWYTTDPSQGLSFEAHSGNYAASAWSWNGAAYDADNWLVTPQVKLEGTLRFWVRTNAGYPDAYEVLLSTTGNAIADFTVTLQAMADAPATGEWEQVSIDLSSYGGANGYIAIHHVSEDKNYLLIDDFGIVTGFVPASEWTTIFTTTTSVELTGLETDTNYEYQVQGVCLPSDESEWTKMTTFTTLGEKDKLFLAEGDWNVDDNWVPAGVPSTTDNAYVRAAVTIPGGVVATAQSIKVDGGSITLKDGGELKTNSQVGVTMEKDITGYGDGEGKFNFIASPASGGSTSTEVEGLMEGDYDYFRFVRSMNLEWRSYALTSFDMTTGNGYLYANKDDQTLKFTGKTWASLDNILSMNATYNASYPMNMILAGNPFTSTSTISFYGDSGAYTGTLYKLNAAGDGFEKYEGYVSVAPGEAVLVEYSENGTIYYESEDYGDGTYLGEAEILLPQHDSTANQDAGPVVVLANDATDNSTVVSTYNNKNVAVKLTGRTLFRDNEWNTLCLPFNVTLAGSPLEGATAKTLTTATMTGTHVALTFGDAVTALQANVPYIIKWDGDGTDNIVEPIFPYVTIVNSDEAGRTVSPIDEVKFIGYYDAFPITAADDNIYYMTSGNTLKHTAKDRTLKSCRAYFDFTESATTGREFVLDFGEGESTTGIFQMPEETKGSDAWYTIDGMKLNGEPTKKGVYINNGKQVIVK